MMSDYPQLVAHRGYMEHYPENSWSGMKAAIDAGALWLECDIQMNLPGEFILLHDGDLARTAADPRSIFGLTERELKKTSIHEPERLGSRFEGEPVISLLELLSRLEGFPDVRIMVEIKQESLEHWGLETVMSPLLNTLLSYRKQVVLISFSLPALQFARTNSGLELGWVLEHYNQFTLDQARQLAPALLITDQSNVPPGSSLETGPWDWMLYDIADPEQAMAWYRRGVQLIETRDIGSMLKALPHPDSGIDTLSGS